MISFIVPAYNEERLLGATLDALHVAARTLDERYELVVVDDASTDRFQWREQAVFHSPGLIPAHCPGVAGAGQGSIVGGNGLLVRNDSFHLFGCPFVASPNVSSGSTPAYR